ncbi:hypothetical protein M2164_001558 [Streptomyces sp. SAI-208]|jgi:hypothetical protein|uniref:hypothetical protein n=1 Tax=unclassified Streptomyces TaxID=2593676 RepID=UPI0024747623|nr:MULTISPECIES: hypothetical protein [unclassified Streptomyces]MDH6515078.1 hypothetical protein [Streptomyces sp. SAI-090]MDH6588688.1 hypothetical protein [Streptomyces sp. SAI-133]MDH6605923.1 hypothetical protein [Streptomyces sp. SAI-208]MDH6620838.1 hypothetical protein [Streptomyces sp. SAI-135]
MSDEPRSALRTEGRRASRRTLVFVLLLATAAFIGTGTALVMRMTGETPRKPAVDAEPGFAPFEPRFAKGGLVTNEFAYLHPRNRQARASRDWIATSGSLFAKDGAGWTGVPDVGDTGADSARHTDSAVFRLVSRRRDFGPVTVSVRSRLEPPVTTPKTPARDWDGGHIWLRYHSPDELYAISFRRRDGAVVIKRKIPGWGPEDEDTGGYATLAEGRHAISYDTWHRVSASAVNLDSGSVRLRLDIDGKTVLTAEDRTPGPLRRPGGVGLRADNTELLFAGFHAMQAPAPTSG